MANEWDQAYDAVQATPAPAATPKQDEWDDAYDTVAGPAADKGPIAKKFLRAARRISNVPILREPGTYPQRFTGAVTKGWMTLGESVLRLPALVVGQAKLASSYIQAEQIHAAKDPVEQKLLRQGMKRSENAYDNIINELSQSAEWHSDGQQRIIENHPEWESEPPKNIIDLILSPDKLSIAIAESLPVLVSAGVLTAAGQPYVASALMFATESNQAFTEAKQNGESDDTARDAAVVYGTVAAVIEQMQLGHIMKIGKGAYKSILNRTVQKVSKDGVKNLTKAIVTVAAKEAVEEMAQGTWGEITAKTIYDRPILGGGGVKGFIDRRAQEAYIGFMMGVIPGVGGAVGGRVASNYNIQSKSRRSIGEDASPEELIRDIEIFTKAHMPQTINKMTAVGGGLEVLLEASINKKISPEKRAEINDRTRRGISADLSPIRKRLASVSKYNKDNSKLLVEGAQVVSALEEYVALADSFLDSPSKKTLNKIQDLRSKIRTLGHEHMKYFYDVVDTLRKHPGYENLKVAPVDYEGREHPIAPLTSGVPGETLTDIARRGDKKALEEALTIDEAQTVEEKYTPESIKARKEWQETQLRERRSVDMREAPPLIEKSPTPVQQTEDSTTPTGAVTGEVEGSLPIPAQHKDAPEFWERLHRRRLPDQSALSQEEEIVVQQIRDSSTELQKTLKDFEAVESFTPESGKIARKAERIFKDIDLQVSQMSIEEVRDHLPDALAPTPTETPYTLVETQSGMEIHDKQTGRIVEHFDNFDKKADKKAVKRLKEMNSDPKKAMKYDKATSGQNARITILGKRLGMIDKKGKTKPAFRRLMKGITGKTVRSKLTYGEAKKLIDTMEKHQPTFREGDKVTPTGSDIVGEVIQLNQKRGSATVQFTNKATGDTNTRIFNMSELAFLGEAQVATEELIETIRETQKITTPKEQVFGQRENRMLKKFWQKIKRQVTGWHLIQMRVNRMMEWLDGHEKGPNWHRIFLPMNQASMEADDAINQRTGDLTEFMTKTFGPDVTKQMLTGKRTPVADPQFKDKISLSPSERIGYYVLSKNKDGLRRIKRGNLGSFGNRETALKAILDSVTEQEKQLGDWALEQLEAQYPRANQAAIIALGRELVPTDNYFPLYAPMETKDAEQQSDFLTELEEKAGTPKVPMAIPETKERVPTATGPVETEFFRSYFHNIARVERFINMAPAVNEVQNLLNNKEYRHTLNKATDGYGVKIISKWMKDTTKGKSTEVNSWTGKMLLGLRRNGMVYAIGYNIPSVMRQVLSLGNGIAIDPLMMKHVPMNWMKNKQGWDNYRTMENEVMGKSLMMRTRKFDRVLTILDSLSTIERRIMGKQEYSQKALSWVRWMDKHTTVLVWKSLYDVATDRNMSEEQAIAFADDGISKTQPMGNARDLPDFFRGGPLEKILSTFQNQVNQNYNFWTHDIVGELKAGKISKKVAGYRVMFSYVMPALLFGMIGRGGPPEDWGDVAKDLALYPLGTPFLVGRIIYNAAQGFAGGGSSVATIGVGELEKTISAGFRGDVGKVIKHGIKATGALTGRIPAQAIRTAEGAYDLAQNETDDWRRLIYSEWALSRGDKGAPGGRRLRKRTTRKRKLRRR